MNRTTQFENPVFASRRGGQRNHPKQPPPHEEPPSLESAAALAKRHEAEASARYNSWFNI